MIDFENLLEEFVEYAKYLALDGDSPDALYESAAYKRLTEEYDNIDELIDGIFGTTTIENFVKEKLTEEWDELRMRHINPAHSVDTLVFRMSLMRENLYQKFLEKHDREYLRNLAKEVMNSKPYNEDEVYAEDKRRYERNNTKSGARRIGEVGSVPSGNHTRPFERRLRDRFNDEDD